MLSAFRASIVAGCVLIASGVVVTSAQAPRDVPYGPYLYPAAVFGSTVTIAWEPVAGAGPIHGYQLEAGRAPGASDVGVYQLGTVPSVTAQNVAIGRYFVRVRARSAEGLGASSNEVHADVDASVPLPPIFGPFPPPAPPPPGPPPPGPPAPGQGFGPGQHRVNVDIEPGRYYSVPVSDCYWERLRGFSGSADDIIANEFIGFNAGQWSVDILATDVGFDTSEECGPWFPTPRRELLASIAPGLWLVGTQVNPGTYSASTQPGCYWARLSNFRAVGESIIANAFVSGGGVRRVTILASDAGFRSDDRCGTWTRSTASSASPSRASSADEIAYHRARRWQWQRDQQPR